MFESSVILNGTKTSQFVIECDSEFESSINLVGMKSETK